MLIGVTVKIISSDGNSTYVNAALVFT